MFDKQRRLRKNRAALLTAALATGLILAGCSTANTDTDGASTETIEGGTLTVSTAPINSLDPQGASAASTGTGTVAKAVFSTLVKTDDDGFVGDLATEWEASEDGTTWTFTLNPDAVFSDGTPVTSEDVAASITRTQTEKGPNASLFAGITAVETPSDNELVLTTTAGGSLLYSLTLLFVGQADSIADPAYWEKPIGSGPFTVESFAAGDTVTLARNDEYWADPATLDHVKLVSLPEVSSQVTAIETGDADILVNIPQDQIPVIEGGGAATVEASDALSIMALWFNNSREPFTDIDVRKAMWMAVDWDKIREDLYGEISNTGTAPIASGVFGWSEQEPYGYDPDEATQLLEDAGYADGFEVEFKYNPTSFSQLQSFLEAAVTYWNEIGVTVKLMPQEQAVYLEDLTSLNWDMTEVVNTSKTGDADQILGRLYTTKANRLGYSNPEVDQLTTEAAASTDQEARAAAYAEVNEILWNDIAGIWPMEVKSVYAVANRVTGFVPDPSGQPTFVDVALTSE